MSNLDRDCLGSIGSTRRLLLVVAAGLGRDRELSSRSNVEAQRRVGTRDSHCPGGVGFGALFPPYFRHTFFPSLLYTLDAHDHAIVYLVPVSKPAFQPGRDRLISVETAPQVVLRRVTLGRRGMRVLRS